MRHNINYLFACLMGVLWYLVLKDINLSVITTFLCAILFELTDLNGELRRK